jgi:hypothetical protein
VVGIGGARSDASLRRPNKCGRRLGRPIRPYGPLRRCAGETGADSPKAATQRAPAITAASGAPPATARSGAIPEKDVERAPKGDGQRQTQRVGARRGFGRRPWGAAPPVRGGPQREPGGAQIPPGGGARRAEALGAAEDLVREGEDAKEGAWDTPGLHWASRGVAAGRRGAARPRRPAQPTPLRRIGGREDGPLDGPHEGPDGTWLGRRVRLGEPDRLS